MHEPMTFKSNDIYPIISNGEKFPSLYPPLSFKMYIKKKLCYERLHASKLKDIFGEIIEQTYLLFQFIKRAAKYPIHFMEIMEHFQANS